MRHGVGCGRPAQYAPSTPLRSASGSRSVLARAARRVLDQPGVGVALWGARSPEPLDLAMAGSLDAAANRAIERILLETATDPICSS